MSEFVLTDAQRALVSANERLAHWIARRRLGELRTLLFWKDADDILTDVQSACLLGLCEAAAAFDPARGVKFCVFATKVIRRHVADYVRYESARRRWFRMEPLTVCSEPDDGHPEIHPDVALLLYEQHRDAHEDLISRIFADQILKDAPGLSPLERQAMASLVEAETCGDMASRLGIPRKQADNAMQRARRKVSVWLERGGYTK